MKSRNLATVEVGLAHLLLCVRGNAVKRRRPDRLLALLQTCRGLRSSLKTKKEWRPPGPRTPPFRPTEDPPPGENSGYACMEEARRWEIRRRALRRLPRACRVLCSERFRSGCSCGRALLERDRRGSTGWSPFSAKSWQSRLVPTGQFAIAGNRLISSCTPSACAPFPPVDLKDSTTSSRTAKRAGSAKTTPTPFLQVSPIDQNSGGKRLCPLPLLRAQQTLTALDRAPDLNCPAKLGKN